MLKQLAVRLLQYLYPDLAVVRRSAYNNLVNRNQQLQTQVEVLRVQSQSRALILEALQGMQNLRQEEEAQPVLRFFTLRRAEEPQLQQDGPVASRLRSRAGT